MDRENIWFTEETKNGEGERGRYFEEEEKHRESENIWKGKGIWFVEEKKKEK